MGMSHTPDTAETSCPANLLLLHNSPFITCYDAAAAASYPHCIAAALQVLPCIKCCFVRLV
jgi:hypothetical protein